MMKTTFGNRWCAVAVASALVVWASASFAVTIAVDSANVNAGEAARICVRLASGGEKIAGTQNDLFWDSSCLALLGKCAVNPLHGKQLSSSEKPAAMKAIVLSFSDVEPIPDGELYCCQFRVLDSAQSDCCSVNIQGASGSDPKGKPITMSAQGGRVCSASAKGGNTGGSASTGGVLPPVVANPNAAAGGGAPSAGGPQTYSGGGPAGAAGTGPGGRAPVVVSGGGASPGGAAVAPGGAVVAPPQAVAPQAEAPQAAVPQAAAPIAASNVGAPAGSVPSIAGGTPAVVATQVAVAPTAPAAAPTVAPTKPAPTKAAPRAATPTEKVEKSSGCQVGKSTDPSGVTLLLLAGAVFLYHRRARTTTAFAVSSTSGNRADPERR